MEMDETAPKTVVLFGDSNTWGHVPGSRGLRHSRQTRWPSRLAAALGPEAEVVAEGLNGRTAAMDRPMAEGLNGLTYLVPCLRSHMPVDVVVFFLGTNDVEYLKMEHVAQSVGRLVKVARACEAGPNGGAPQVLVVCPPAFDGHEFGPAFAKVCDELECDLVDLGGVTSYVSVGDDRSHLDEAGHAAVADAVEPVVRRLLGYEV